MKKKVISIILILIIAIAFLLSYVTSYADNSKTIYISLAKSDFDNIGYGIGDPTQQGGKYIWNIVEYNSNDVSDISATQRNLYCIKAEYGTTWQNAQKPTDIVEYNLSYNLQKDREEILAKLVDNETTDDVIKELLDPEGSAYREILWILDNVYIPGTTDKTEYLKKAGIDTDWYSEYPLTDADIKAVEKMAIWYFTNYKIDNDSNYDKTTNTDWLQITTNGGLSYTNLSQLTHMQTEEGEDRNKQAEILYKYLVSSAQSGASNYTSENNYTISKPVSVNTSGLTKVDNKYQLKMTRNGENYIVGPIIIDKNNDLQYEIAMTVTNQSGTTVEYKYVDSNGTELENVAELKDAIGIDGGFYISVARKDVEQVNIKIDITNTTRIKTLWLNGTETEDSITLNGEQPIVEVTIAQDTETTELVANPNEFDLALRKYITEINGVKLSELNLATRAPSIDLSSLQTGTTATYRHKKDPVVVAENDIVTYSIAIFNEGNIDGYASQIIDQLPTGLVYIEDSGEVDIISKDKNGNDRNTYKVTYSPTYNTITFDIQGEPQSLTAYTTGNLDYEIITLKCKVVQSADDKDQKILTNVAWISDAKDSNGEDVTDRDSQPTTSPNVNKGNMEDYKGNTNNQDDLTDNNYFYEGEQDDDDFEKLVIMPIVKNFDLALFKHIAAISKDPIIEDGEYITDTGSIDGTYLRAPVVTAIDPETGKITYQEDDKAALTVEPGDYVLYTIRVYNEGEIDGYASKIKDTLPVGLEFVTDNVEYNGIWKLEGIDEDGRQVVTTTWFAKGQGAELNSVVGDENYTANLLHALDKTAPISDENPDYLDAQILCKVVEQATSDRVLVNYAQISDDSDEDGEPIDDIDSTPDEWIDTDDDQDIERIKLQCFDLSLRKFITAVNGVDLKDSDGKYLREPVVDVTPLVEGTDTTAIYTHPKTPVSVQVGDKVVYTIRVYNEGDIKGYAGEITDYLPPYLTFVEDSEINEKYGWEISEDGRIATTRYTENTELDAFDGTAEGQLDYTDVQIECVIADTAVLRQNITNIAEISEYKYNGNVVDKDIDSTADDLVSKDFLPEDEDLPSYKDDEIENPYVPGNEDDDDFEKVYVKEFDLALRKFITQVGTTEVTSRIPQVKIEDGQITYEHTKEPVTLHVGDVVTYTLRIFNEGEIDGYASEIRDNIPEYLEFLPEDSTNVEYMWKMYDENDEETTDVSEAVSVKTDYLSKENEENGENLIKAFDGTTLSYKDIKIAFRVKDPNSNQYIITNYAQIADDEDENGNSIEDKDSTPDEWNDGEDDQDIENVKVEYFDLSLLKFVSKVIVIEDGQEKITETGYNGHEDPEPVVKVELYRKNLNNVVVKFEFGITITNEGDIAGYASEITDYVPEGLRFEAADNPEWTDEGNNIISTTQLNGTLLQPGESATVHVTLTWNNGEDNLAEKTNTAEISKDDNEYDVPDRDSTPDNQKEGEDDIDIAKVILTISTGAAQTYFGITLGLLSVVLVGVILIKKFVL